RSQSRFHFMIACDYFTVANGIGLNSLSFRCSNHVVLSYVSPIVYVRLDVRPVFPSRPDFLVPAALAYSCEPWSLWAVKGARLLQKFSKRPLAFSRVRQMPIPM